MLHRLEASFIERNHVLLFLSLLVMSYKFPQNPTKCFLVEYSLTLFVYTTSDMIKYGVNVKKIKTVHANVDLLV